MAEGEPPARPASYEPAIHGDYNEDAPAVDAAAAHAATRIFNRDAGTTQAPDLNPEAFNTENKWRRQVNEFLQHRC